MDGNELWTTSTTLDSCSSPAATPATVVIACMKSVVAYSAADGTKKWTKDLPYGVNPGAGPIIDNSGRVHVVVGSTLYAFKLDTGEEIASLATTISGASGGNVLSIVSPKDGLVVGFRVPGNSRRELCVYGLTSGTAGCELAEQTVLDGFWILHSTQGMMYAVGVGERKQGGFVRLGKDADIVEIARMYYGEKSQGPGNFTALGPTGVFIEHSGRTRRGSSRGINGIRAYQLAPSAYAGSWPTYYRDSRNSNFVPPE